MGEEDYLSVQVAKLEARFDKHAEKMEERLDQIVEIMRIVAQLQERDIHQAQAIQRLESALGQAKLANEDVVKRLFVKIEETERMVTLNESKHSEVHDTIFSEIRNNKATVDGYVNKGSGIWKTLGVVYVLLQAVGLFILNAMYDIHKQDVERGAAIEHRVTDIEQGNRIRDIKMGVKE